MPPPDVPPAPPLPPVLGAAPTPAASRRIWNRLQDPPTAFYFRVSFGAEGKTADGAFKEVSGIGPEMETETYQEGGENRYTLALPKAVKHPRLSLKRGIAPSTSPLLRWCQAVLEGGLAQPISPQQVFVTLMNANGDPLRNWSLAHAYPVKLEVEGFGATKNEVAIEKIELSYAYSERRM